MFRWIPYAMVRVTIFFVSGIGVAIQFPGIFGIEWVIGGTLLYLVFRNGAVGLITIFLFGYVRTEIHTEKNDTQISVTHYKAVVARYAEEKANSWKLESTTDHGRVLLYLSKKDFYQPYSYGDVLLIKGAPQLVKAPSNPGEFDLKQNLHFKNIHHQHYLKAGQVILIGHEDGNPFIAAAIKVRLWSDKQLKTYVKGEREQATASALVLGVTDGLDSDLLQAYASTGAMHVLAVSGLHVSIIYWIILLLGKPIEKLKSGKAILAVISVVLLWIYAFVTGWSPSVLRAVMMFTFVAMARPWKQSTNIYNTMAASAFCLLLYDPFFLMSVGFQLSYIAVFGIVFIHPHLYVLWEPKRRLWDEIWKVTSVSIAAQIATVPISLYYFHQFPNYFLVANLLVIPASFVVLVAGLAVLPAAFVPVIASVVGFGLQWVIWIMNSIVVIIGALPFAVIRGIYIDGLQALLLAGITLSVLLCFLLKNIRWLWLALLLSIGFSVADWIHVYSVVNKNHITVYNINGKTTIDLISNGELYSYGEFDPFRMTTNRVRLGVRSSKTLSGNFVTWKGVRIFIAKGPIQPGLETDILILSNNAFRNLPPVNCKKIIIDSSNSLYIADELLREKTPSGVHVHSVAHNGAFQYSF
ncbi:MAG: ComEC/Rec2 family competence protein [Bacteroidota bacterium]